jgi:hypothetical protein
LNCAAALNAFGIDQSVIQLAARRLGAARFADKSMQN